MRGLLALVLLAVPTAGAVDILPVETRLGPTEAIIVVRSATGAVNVTAEPVVLAAAADEPAPTPRTVRSPGPWRGMDGVIEVTLRRDDPKRAVDLVIEDGASAGLWVEWPAHERKLPAPGALGAVLALALLALARRR